MVAKKAKVKAKPKAAKKIKTVVANKDKKKTNFLSSQI